MGSYYSSTSHSLSSRSAGWLREIFYFQDRFPAVKDFSLAFEMTR